MKKEVLLQFLFAIPFILLVALVRNLIHIGSWSFFVGGILGTLLPYADHLIYIYFLKPQDLSSQRVSYYMQKRNIGGALDTMISTKEERKNLVFHTFYFQLIFTVLTFYIITSSGSLLGMGLVLCFYLHMLLDQLEEYGKTGSILSWFRNQDIVEESLITSKFSRVYMAVIGILLLLFSFFF